MSQVGKLFVDDAGDMAGGIRTMKVRQSFAMRENPEPCPEGRDPDKWPSHLIEAKAADGEAVEIGAAWRKSKVDDRGRYDYLSLSFTDPDFPEWMRNLAAFPVEGSNGTEFRIVS